MLTKHASLYTLLLLTFSILLGSASAQSDTDRLLKTLTGHTDNVQSVSFSPDGNIIASGSEDETVRLWNANTGRLLNTLTGHRREVSSVSFSPDGNKIASGSWNGTVRLWDVNTGRLLKTFREHIREHIGAVYSVSFSPDGKTIASGSADKTVRLWDINTGKVLKTLTGHTNGVYSVSFSPDGKTIASGSADKTVRLWEANTGRVLKTLTGHASGVNSVSFSPDGNIIASGSWDKTVCLWEVNTGRHLKTLIGHTRGVNNVSFSPDRKTIASGSNDSTVRLWEVNTGKLLKTLTGHTNWVNSVSFSPDGNIIASGSSDNTFRLWAVNAFGARQPTLAKPQTPRRRVAEPETPPQTPRSRPTVAQPQTAEQIAKIALASTVLIVMQDADGEAISTGSGFILKGDRVATNLHVVEGVLRGYVKLVGGDRRHRITGIIAMDRDQDLAVLSVVGIDAPPLRLAYHRKVSVGERVYVAGNPIGFLEGTFSDGLVSGIRDLGYDRQWLQISAPISEGSSGGPVLNQKGEVIGIAVAQLTVGQNLNFAIPVKYLTDLLEQIGR